MKKLILICFWFMASFGNVVVAQSDSSYNAAMTAIAQVLEQRIGIVFAQLPRVRTLSLLEIPFYRWDSFIARYDIDSAAIFMHPNFGICDPSDITQDAQAGDYVPKVNTVQEREFCDPNLLRNVLAHELGHSVLFNCVDTNSNWLLQRRAKRDTLSISDIGYFIILEGTGEYFRMAFGWYGYTFFDDEWYKPITKEELSDWSKVAYFSYSGGYFAFRSLIDEFGMRAIEYLATHPLIVPTEPSPDLSAVPKYVAQARAALLQAQK